MHFNYSDIFKVLPLKLWTLITWIEKRHHRVDFFSNHYLSKLTILFYERYYIFYQNNSIQLSRLKFIVETQSEWHFFLFLFLLQRCLSCNDVGYVHKFNGWLHHFWYPWKFSSRTRYRRHQQRCSWWNRSCFRLLSRCHCKV